MTLPRTGRDGVRLERDTIRLRLGRIFWIGAAAILVVAALVAVSSILGGDFSETDGKILGTLFSLLLAGAVVISGYALVERETLVPLGWAAVVWGTVAFTVLAAAIWSSFENETLGRWAGTMTALLVALLLVTTQRLLLRVEGLTILFFATAVVAGLAVLATGAAIWGERDGGGDAPGTWEASAIFWILTALGFMLVPVLQRFTATGASPADIRVLATLGDVELVASRGPLEGVAVETPSAGERLVLRHRHTT